MNFTQDIWALGKKSRVSPNFFFIQLHNSLGILVFTIEKTETSFLFSYFQPNL